MNRKADSKLVRNLFYRLPVLLYCVLIYIQSSFPGVAGIEPPFSGFDKVLHFAGYSLLGVLTLRALLREDLSVSPSVLAGIAVVFCTLYGLSDEIHQSFVSGRSCEALDLLADAAGGAAGAYVYLTLKGPARKTGRETHIHEGES